MKKLISIVLLVQINILSIIGAVNIHTTDKIFDTKLIQTDEIEYTEPENVLIAPIFTPENIYVSDYEKLKGLFYYLTVRLGFVDMPFHYVVLPNGDIYQTSSIGDEQKVQIDGIEGNSVVIAYISKSGAKDFSDKARASIQQLSLDIANRNSIKSENLILKNLRAVLNLDTKTSKLQTREIAGGWSQSFLQIQHFVEANYQPVKKDYRMQVLEVKSPDSEVTPGDTVIIELKIKNIGENSVYKGSLSELLLSKEDGSLSKFYSSSSWISRSQTEFMNEGDMLRPQQEQSFQVKFHVPLFFGHQEETFVLKNMNGDVVSDSFTIALNVKNLDVPVIEILPTKIGYLNVRNADSGHAEIIGRVTPGERFIEKSRGQNGYVQIQFTDEKDGWVFSKYTKRVN